MEADNTDFSSQSSPSPEPEVAHKASARRSRLAKEGAEILIDAFQNQGITNPTPKQKQTLLEQINALPQCGDYDKKRLETWFINARRRRVAPSYRSIKNLKTLRDLFTYTPNPTEQAITTWAKLLGAQLTDVKAWVSAEQETLERPHESTSASLLEHDGTPKLPTDESSSSLPVSKRRLGPILPSGSPPLQPDVKRKKKRQKLSPELSRSPSLTVQGWSDSPLHAPPDLRRKFYLTPDSSMISETTEHLPTARDSPTFCSDTSISGPFTLPINPLLVTPTDAAEHLKDTRTDSLMKPLWIPKATPMPETLGEESALVPPTHSHDSVGPSALAVNLPDSSVLAESYAPGLRTLLNHLLGPTDEKNGFPK